MMRNQDKYAVAVRKPNQEIEIDVQEFKSVMPFKGLSKVPFVRGMFAFVDSLVLGLKILSFSASFYEDEETEADQAKKTEKNEKRESMIQAAFMVVGVILAIGIFFVLPFFISGFFRDQISSRMLLVTIEGLIRIGIFFAYILLISRLKDIQRTFMYHGAEHKCINCIEHGLPLTVENVKGCSKEHKRCGTSFLFFVMVVSIVFSFFITVDSQVLRVVFRLALLPLIAGVSYEIIRLAGKTNNIIIGILSKPGLWMQHLTTKEPEDDMIEVAIEAVEAIFDWKAFQAKEEDAA